MTANDWTAIGTCVLAISVFFTVAGWAIKGVRNIIAAAAYRASEKALMDTRDKLLKVAEKDEKSANIARASALLSYGLYFAFVLWQRKSARSNSL